MPERPAAPALQLTSPSAQILIACAALCALAVVLWHAETQAVGLSRLFGDAGIQTVSLDDPTPVPINDGRLVHAEGQARATLPVQDTDADNFQTAIEEQVTRKAAAEQATELKNDRKAIIREQLKKIGLFQSVTQFLHETEDHRATRDQLLEKLAELLPNENAELSFQTVVNWGRYAELFGYNGDSESFYLDTESGN
jgi:hypothetical protein